MAYQLLTLLLAFSNVLEATEWIITEDSDSGNTGNMFSLKATTSDVTINSFTFNFNGCAASSSYYFAMYKLKTYGSFVGSETNSDAWEVVCEGTVACAYNWNGASFDFGNANTGNCVVDIPAGTIQSLYLHGGSRGLVSEWSTGAVDTFFDSDGTLEAYVGRPVSGLFGSGYLNATAIPKISVIYDVATTAEPTSSPTTAAPTLPQALQDAMTFLVTDQSSSGNDGNMFDLTALNEIIVTNIRFNYNGCASSSYDFVLYKLKATGSFFGSETDSDAWEVACSGTVVCAYEWNGSSYDFGNADTSDAGECLIEIPAGTTQGMYLHGIDRGLVSLWTGTLGDVFADDGNLQINVGRPVSGLFGQGSLTDSAAAVPTIEISYNTSQVMTTSTMSPDTTTTAAVTTTDVVTTTTSDPISTTTTMATSIAPTSEPTMEPTVDILLTNVETTGTETTETTEDPFGGNGVPRRSALTVVISVAFVVALGA